MLISPPFLPARNADDLDAAFVDAAMPDAAVNCAGTSVPEGSFPVSLKLGWHGGVHLHAPSGAAGVLPVRAIADGEIVYARRPTTQVDTPTHPLNYNPYGDQAAWTDDGMVVIKHTTDIGDGANAQDVVFYSVYMHLSQLRGAANTVAASATAITRPIYRKDEIGSAGRIYAAPDHIHFEIVCDDANLNKLINRQTGDLALTTDGRTDAVYGEIYFHLPVGTTFYENNPGATVVTPTAAPLYTSNSDLFIGLRYAGGEGVAANRGDAYLCTYLADGTQLGDAAGVIEDNQAEYNIYTTANDFATAQPLANRPTPSSVHEFLRFGRVIDTTHETAIPASIPHWKQVRYERGLAWVNLNNQAGDLRVHVFSDADFPQWRGWKLIQDDTDDDSRCESALLTGLIEDASAADGRLSPAELIQRLGESTVRKALETTICKFPSELNRDTIDARWGWLQSDPEYQLVGESWTNFRAHVEALTVPAASLPEPLRTAHWHFNPRTFIRQFRKCKWLSVNELIQLIPSHAIRTAKKVFWEAVNNGNPITENNHHVIRNHRVALLKMMRKYGISSAMRQASFFGNSIQETTWFGTLSEGGGPSLWYAPWYGRGFLQLTNPENYCNYWSWRGRSINSALKTALINAYKTIANTPKGVVRSNIALQDLNFTARPAPSQLTTQMINWRSAVQSLPDPQNEEERFAPSDSAGFYWVKNQMAMYADRDHVIVRVPVITALSGSKVYYRSLSFWQASAAVNLPSRISSITYSGINGFDSRCCAYGVAVVVLSEKLLPDAHGNLNVPFPEGYTPRRPS